jgi:hypothetical protein
MLLFRAYVMKFEVCQEYITPDILQTSLHKDVTAQSTPDTTKTTLQKHGTAQNTADIPKTSLYKQGTMT